MRMSSERKRVNIANCYQDGNRGKAYATLEFANTYYLAFRDLPGLIGITGHSFGSNVLNAEVF